MGGEVQALTHGWAGLTPPVSLIGCNITLPEGDMDVWNPASFDDELRETLTCYSNLIIDYYREEQILMDEHLNSNPYESLKANRFYSEYSTLYEQIVTPQLADRRIRVWHYTRLLDSEVTRMRSKLVPSTLASFAQRLDMLVGKNLLTREEAEIVYSQSPLHSQQSSRSGRLWTTSVPMSASNHGVEPLLGSWGGESAYFWLSDDAIAEKLRNIGKPRIVEIDTALRDKLNSYSVARTVIQSWAKSLGQSVSIEGSDLSITDCLETAKVLVVHSPGDGVYEAVAESYPVGWEQHRVSSLTTDNI